MLTQEAARHPGATTIQTNVIDVCQRSIYNFTNIAYALQQLEKVCCHPNTTHTSTHSGVCTAANLTTLFW